jgi:hypothetical protein
MSKREGNSVVDNIKMTGGVKVVLTRDFLIGFLAGAVTGVVGYRVYEQNSGQLQRILRPQAGQVDNTTGAEPDLEDLVAQKERLEDLIAERKLENN